jgi:hypothetical protein
MTILTVRLVAPALGVFGANQQVSLPSNGVGGGPNVQGSTPGQVGDFDLELVDRLVMAGGWVRVGRLSGPTSARPAGSAQGNPAALNEPAFRAGPGFLYFDSTLGKIIIWDGATWRDPNTGDAV